MEGPNHGERWPLRISCSEDIKSSEEWKTLHTPSEAKGHSRVCRDKCSCRDVPHSVCTWNVWEGEVGTRQEIHIPLGDFCKSMETQKPSHLGQFATGWESS